MEIERRIQVSTPINTSCQNVHLFEKHLTYSLPVLGIKYIEGAFVTNSGLVCTSEGLIKECSHHTWEWQYETCLVEASQYYNDAKEDPKNLTELDDEEIYLVVHHPWYKNYYHWLTETFLRLYMVKEKTESMILLLPSKENLPNFVPESLKILNFKAIYHIPTKGSVLVRNLCMPMLKPTMASYLPEALIGLNRLFREKFSSIESLDLGERIYVSRKKSRRRWIVNEDEVIFEVKKFGFRVVYNEDYTFPEQVSLYSKARLMISLHGAAMTNMLFMKKGSMIFELCKSWTNLSDKHNFIFWYMSDALGYKFLHQMCEPVNADEHYFTANVLVDIALLKRNLELMC